VSLEAGTSSVGLTQLGMYQFEDGNKIQSPKCCILKKDRTTDHVQNYNSYTGSLFKIPPEVFLFFISFPSSVTVTFHAKYFPRVKTLSETETRP
jgi:hypothetical protein